MELQSRKSAASTAKRKKVDWAAVERDYRTGKFTLRELAEKYGVSHQAIAKRSQVHKWTQDLADQIRLATNAKLVASLVDSQVAAGGQAIANTVLAAAELNAQVVMRHRKRLHAIAEDADIAKAKVLSLADSVADMREAGVLVNALEGLARISKTLIEQERVAYKLDDAPASQITPKRVVLEFHDVEEREL